MLGTNAHYGKQGNKFRTSVEEGLATWAIPSRKSPRMAERFRLGFEVRLKGAATMQRVLRAKKRRGKNQREFI